MKNLNLFVKAVLAGVYIAIAGAVYLITSYSITGVIGMIIGGLLFSIGLLTIVVKDYYLYTGKVGYLLPYDSNKGIKVVGITLLGNIVGIVTIALIMNIIKVVNLEEFAIKAVNSKFSNPWYVSLVSAFFCGILMYTAVDGYNKMKDSFAKVLIVFLSVIVFLVMCFDHSIANMAYLVYAKQFSWKILGLLLIMIIGNGLGGITMNLLHTVVDKTNK